MNKFIWLLVISSILFSLFGTRIELLGGDLVKQPIYNLLLSPFDNVRYGHFVVRKLFLVGVAFFVFGYWLTTQKKILEAIKNNLKYISLIGLVLTLSRILTFGFWFYNDDTRFFHWHLFAPTQPDFNPQGMWGPIGLHPIAIFLLVIRWFGTNYALYNTLGLIFFFLAGAAIFALVSKLQNNKFVSLATAIFFLTTPTYFQGRLLIGEIVNSPFIVLLVVLSIFLLLHKFIPGALIFAAAALEYGVAKTYFIAMPLTLFAIFFANSVKNLINMRMMGSDKLVIFFVAAVFLISLVYKPAFYRAPSYSNLSLGSVSEIIKLDQLFVFGDVLLSVTMPYGLSYPLVYVLSKVLNGWIYITAALGFFITTCFAVIGITSYLRGKILTAKLTIIGLSIILPTAAIASFMGVRVDHNVAKLVEYHNNGFIPGGATGYGIFPALGLTFILIGLGYLIRKRVFIILAVFLILINTITSMVFDYRWLQSPYSYPQRRYDQQLQKILLRDGIAKYVYVPSKQRPLYASVVTFGSIFQGDQEIYTFMDPGDFVKKIKEDRAQKDHIYFLITSAKPKYEIYDYSEKIRSTPKERLTPLIESLTKELTPGSLEF